MPAGYLDDDDDDDSGNGLLVDEAMVLRPRARRTSCP